MLANIQKTSEQHTRRIRWWTLLQSDEGVRISVVFDYKQITYKLQNKCSIFTAEATAILKSIKAILLITKEDHTKCVTLSDLLSTINSIKNNCILGDMAMVLQNKLWRKPLRIQ